MNFAIRASDWKVCIIGDIGVGVIVAGGIFWMGFYSPSVSTSHAVRFRFAGAGFGLGGNISSFALPGVIPDVWTDIPCDQSFNVWDLNGAAGAIGNAGVGVGLSAGVTNMKANKGSNVFFDFDGDLGLSGGFGAGISGLAGTYAVKGIVQNVPDDDWQA
jgi:hypothetical protein